jgi:hypothetical protein
MCAGHVTVRRRARALPSAQLSAPRSASLCAARASRRPIAFRDSLRHRSLTKPAVGARKATRYSGQAFCGTGRDQGCFDVRTAQGEGRGASPSFHRNALSSRLDLLRRRVDRLVPLSGQHDEVGAASTRASGDVMGDAHGGLVSPRSSSTGCPAARASSARSTADSASTSRPIVLATMSVASSASACLEAPTRPGRRPMISIKELAATGPSSSCRRGRATAPAPFLH